MQNNEGDNYYVDLDSIKATSSNTFRILQKVEPKASARQSHVISKLEMDCKANSIRLLKVTSFDSNGKGRILKKNNKWRDVSPEDIEELLLELVCSLKKTGN